MIAAGLPVNEEARLAALKSYAILDTEPEAAFDTIVDLAATFTDCPMATISLIDEHRQWFKARRGVEAIETERVISFCAHAILDPLSPLILPDPLLDERFADNPLVLEDPAIRFYAGVPLVNPEGLALGTLCVLDTKPREMSTGEQQVLSHLSAAVMTLLELRRAKSHLSAYALIDPQTSLPNAAALRDAVAQAITAQRRDSERFSLLHVCLKGTESVFDQLGDRGHDTVMREVAIILRQVLRNDDFAARAQDDDFVLLIKGDKIEAHAAANRLKTAFKARMARHQWRIVLALWLSSFRHTPSDVDAALSASSDLIT